MSAGGIVWILGAGFSMPLGGPSLPKLLSNECQRRILARFPDAEPRLFKGDSWAYIYRMLQRNGWELQDSAKRVWRDAEEFLEFLDLAAHSPTGGPSRRLLNAYGGPHPDSSDGVYAVLTETAKKLVAADCCFFRDTDVAFEKWSPYRTWAKELQPEDTVITFNYDRVTEAAAAASGRALDLMLGSDDRIPDATKLLKLHGSVDWKMDSNERIACVPNATFAVLCDFGQIALGTPGPSKRLFAEKMEELWNAAREAILRANAIVFVGYRFPETDAYAREHLLGAIKDSKVGDLAVHTVLGPDLNPDTRRLEQLLRSALHRGGRRDVGGVDEIWQPSPPQRYRLIVHQLFGQDFIGLASRDEILKPR